MQHPAYLKLYMNSRIFVERKDRRKKIIEQHLLDFSTAPYLLIILLRENNT